jgi:hypothetical protein
VKTASWRRRSTFAAELGIGRRSPVPMGGTTTASGGSVVDSPPELFWIAASTGGAAVAAAEPMAARPDSLSRSF